MPKYSRFLSTLWRRLNTWLANVEDILDALDHARMEDADPLHTLRLLRYRYQQLIKWMYAALAALSVAVALAFAVDTPLDDLLLGRPVENRPVVRERCKKKTGCGFDLDALFCAGVHVCELKNLKPDGALFLTDA